MVLAELRGRQQEAQEQAAREKAEKEKSESRNDLPYASIVNRNNSTASVSTGFTGYTDWDGNPPSFDSHDWQSTHTARAGGMVSSISGTSFRSDGTHMSPSESNHGGLTSSTSHNSMKQFHKERVQARSYGFTGSASFRDNNYLRSVQKAKANGSIDANGSVKSPRTNDNALPNPDREQNGAASPHPSSNGSSMTKATSLSDVFYSPNGTSSPQLGSASLNGNESTSPYSQRSRDLPVNGDRASEHSKSPISTMSDQPLADMRTVPKSDDEGTPRDAPTGRSTQRGSVLQSMDPQQMKRVSLALLEIETHLGRELARPADDPTEVNLNDDEREEILDGDDENEIDERDRVQSPVRGQQPVTEVSHIQPAVAQTQQPQQAQQPPAPQQQHQHQQTQHPHQHQHQQTAASSSAAAAPAMLDRQNSTASTTSSVFPFTASPASSAHVSRVGTSETRASIITNDIGNGDATPTIGSLPSSPRTLDFQRHLSSHSSHASHGSQSQSQSHQTSSSHSPHYTHNPMPSTSSVGTEIDNAEVIPQPVLKPYRPQPVRATPTPVPGASSGYVPGQPRPVGRANGGNSISSIASSTASPLAALTSPISSPVALSRSSHDGPARPPQAAPASSQQLSRAVSTQSNQSQQSRATSSRPTSTRVYVPPAGALTSRQHPGHAQNHSIHSLTESINAGSVSPHLGKLKLADLNGHATEYLDESEGSEEPEKRGRDSHMNMRSPPSVPSTIRSSANLSPPDVSDVEDLTPPPSLAELAAPSSLRSYGRTASMNSFSSNFNNSPDLESNSPWDAIVNAEKSPLDSMQYWAQSEQDRNQIDLLKSISGMGKEDLAMIQGQLVEKAKQDGVDGESPITEQPLINLPWSPFGGPNIDDSTEHIPIPPSFMNVTDLPKGPPPPRPPPPSECPAIPMPTSPPIAAMHSRNQSSQQIHSPIDMKGSISSRNFDPSASVSSRGPPSQPRPSKDFGGSVAGHERMVSNAKTESEAGHGTDHSRNVSNSRKWLDDDPSKRRDIEERIRGATTDLFRAPSRSAHKRHLSKKQIKAIGDPQLVSTSHNVPCTPIVSTLGKENDPKQGKKLDKKKSMRWRKLSSFKKPSVSDMPPPTPNPPLTLQPAGKSSSPTPPASSVVQLKSKHEIMKAQQRAKAGDSVSPDLAEFKFPRAPSTTPNGQANGNGPSPSPAPENGSTQPPPAHDRSASNSTQLTQLTQRTQTSKASTGTSKTSRSPSTKVRSPSSSTNNFRSPSSSISQLTPPATRAPSSGFPSTPNDFAPVDHAEDDTMRPYSRQRGHSRQASDASVAISTFMEAGRTLGIDENRLSNMLAQTGVYDRPGTGMSMRSRTHSRSQTPSFSMHSPPISPSVGTTRFGSISSAANGPWRIPSPVAEDKLERHLSNDSNRPQVVRRTIVVPDDGDSQFRASMDQQFRASIDQQYRPSMDSYRPSIDGFGGRPSTPPLQLQRAETNHSVQSGVSSPSRSMVRGNSIRRKPVQQWNGSEQEILPRSPLTRTHGRTQSNASEAEEELHFPPPINFDSQSGTRSARSSMGPSVNGSIYDYYGTAGFGDRDSVRDSYRSGGRDSMAGTGRASQAVEITEYSDGRVIWNVVNALRNGDDERRSVVSTSSQASDTGSDYAPSGREDLPWRVGPTERLDFMRRPETRVYYTSSADVGDLIDQLSSDLAGASRGRIDIRPSSPREWGEETPQPSPAGLPLTFTNTPLKGSSLRYPVPDSPRASYATTSEEGGERTVEDRLQALMDRLKAAPGGVGRAPSRTAV